MAPKRHPEQVGGSNLARHQGILPLSMSCLSLEKARAVMPAHEFGLVISGAEADVLVLLKLGVHIKGEWPHPCRLRHILLSLSDKRLLACTVTLLFVAPSETEGVFFWMSGCLFSSTLNSSSSWSWLAI